MLQIKQNDNFSSRLLSKGRNSIGESSFRVLYYGKSCGSVPFTWETKPGTPKHPGSHSSLPPLTPPPSFQVNGTPNTKLSQKGAKPNFLLTIFHRKSSKSSHVSPSYPSSPSISSSSCSSSLSRSSTSVPMNSFIRRHGWLSRAKSTGGFGINGHDHHEEAAGSPTPTTSCLGGGYVFFRQISSRRSKVNVKFPL